MMLPKTCHEFPGVHEKAMPELLENILDRDSPNVVDELGNRLFWGWIKVTCPECGKRFEKEVSETEAEDIQTMYENGGHHPAGHVQDVFPDWTTAERELYLMSHMCDDCWNRVMAPPGSDEKGGI